MARQKSTGPRALMTPAALHILMALAEEDRHGYAVKQVIEERTGGDLILGPGTLYEAIHRMVRDGWVIEVADAGDGEAGRRRYYRITAAGRREMQMELARLEALVSDARARRLMARPRRA